MSSISVKCTAMACAAALILGGCSLLPEEAEAPSPPLIYAYEKTNYTFANVERGDILETKRVTFRYMPSVKQSLAFDVNGAALDAVYVSVGDDVKEGELLCELEDGGLSDEIDAVRETIAGYERTLEEAAESSKLELERYDLRIAADPENESLKDGRKAAEENYKANRRTTELRLAAEKARLDELLSDEEKHRLYAPFAGTVTYVKSFGGDGFTSTAGETFITISDKTSMVFSCDETDAKGLFAVGDVVTVNIGGEEYEAEVVSTEGSVASIVPRDYTETAAEGAYGVVSITQDAVYGVLRVPSGAVKSANGRSIVYMLEDGVRVMRNVETGFSADGMTEIVSGLEEGEQVIVS